MRSARGAAGAERDHRPEGRVIRHPHRQFARPPGLALHQQPAASRAAAFGARQHQAGGGAHLGRIVQVQGQAAAGAVGRRHALPQLHHRREAQQLRRVGSIRPGLPPPRLGVTGMP